MSGHNDDDDDDAASDGEENDDAGEGVDQVLGDFYHPMYLRSTEDVPVRRRR